MQTVYCVFKKLNHEIVLWKIEKYIYLNSFKSKVAKNIVPKHVSGQLS